MAFQFQILPVPLARLQAQIAGDPAYTSPRYQWRDFLAEPKRVEMSRAWSYMFEVISGCDLFEAGAAPAPWNAWMHPQQRLDKPGPEDIPFLGHFYLLPDQVAALAQGLAQLGWEAFWKRTSQVEVDASHWIDDIPPGQWEETLRQDWQRMEATYAQAAAQGEAVINFLAIRFAPSYFIHFQGQLIGEVHSTGGDFPWHCGYIQPTEGMKPLLPFARWASKHIDYEPYHPWDEDLEDSPEWPQDDHQRFLLSDNHKVVQAIDTFLAHAAAHDRAAMTRAELQAAPTCAEFLDLWNPEWMEETIDRFTTADLQAYRAYLLPQNWRIADSEDIVCPMFGNPPRFDPETLDLCWR